MAAPCNPPVLQTHPIAIVGMGCRLPGDVSSPSDLWKLLSEQRSGHGPVPPSRYNAEAFYHEDADHLGTVNSTGGYFLNDDVRAFENAFFGIHNLESQYMDPQQRKLLEVVYEAFESAGVTLQSVKGSNTGVYVGNFTTDHMITAYRDSDAFTRFTAVGAGISILSNRLSHCFDLRGPSLTLDTACASSMYGLHLACMALDQNECEAAVVAAANLIQSPETQIAATKAGILSPESVSHSFDASANGYGRAEGVEALYLKRLDDAIRDGDPVRAIIRGTAVNSNGRTPGITLPATSGQQAVILKAHQRAGLGIDETDYVEAHGTGTKVGDPIELESIGTILQHKTGRPTLVGSIKPTLGHSEASSGISSIMKVVLALENRQIPATIGVKIINPDAKCAERNVEVVTAPRPWPQSSKMRAGVNSFGFGGANGHVVLEAPAQQTTSNGHQDDESRFLILPFSARSKKSLLLNIDRLRDYTRTHRDHLSKRRLAMTLAQRRSRLAVRGFIVTDTADMGNQMIADHLKLAETPVTKQLSFCFIFTGQGAQWPRMGSQLLQCSSTFLGAIRRLDSALQSLGEDGPAWKIEDVLAHNAAEEIDVHRPDKAQTLCTAVQIALVLLLHSLGVSPDFVVGHSSGELAASFTAGKLSLEQAIAAAFLRGKVVTKCGKRGQMMAVGLSDAEAQKTINESGMQDRLTVACVNAPDSVTISGDVDAATSLQEALTKRQVFARLLKTGSSAYHSHHMREIGPIYEAAICVAWEKLSRIPQTYAQTSGTRMVSTVSGSLLNDDELSEATYWRRNLESPVQFKQAISSLLAESEADFSFIEIGPHPSLKLPVTQTRQAPVSSPIQYSSTLVRGTDARKSILELVGDLYLRGFEAPLCRASEEGLGPDLHASQDCLPLHDLPPYAWDYEDSPMVQSRAAIEFKARKYPPHELLGSRLPGLDPGVKTWRTLLDVANVPWLRDHCLGPATVFPAAGYLSMAVEAICQSNELSIQTFPGCEMRNICFARALDLTEPHSKVELFTELRPLRLSNAAFSKEWLELTVSSVTQDDRRVHVSIQIRLSAEPRVVSASVAAPDFPLSEQPMRLWYDKFTKVGLRWGPQFASMKRVFADRRREAQYARASTTLVQATDNLKGGTRYLAHPAIIDGLLQTAFVATAQGRVGKLRAKVPVAMAGFSVSAPGLVNHASLEGWHMTSRSELVGFGTSVIDADLDSPNGQTLVSMEGVRCVAYQGNEQSAEAADAAPMSRLVWRPEIAMSLTEPKLFDRYDSSKLADSSAGPAMVRARALAAVTDLAVHHNPMLRITLIADADDEIREMFEDVLSLNTIMRRCDSFKIVSLKETGHGAAVNGTVNGHVEQEPTASGESGLPDSDLILLHELADGPLDLAQYLWHLQSLCSRKPNMVVESDGHEFKGFQFDGYRRTAVTAPGSCQLQFLDPILAATNGVEHKILHVIHGDAPSDAELSICAELERSSGMFVRRVSASEVPSTTLSIGDYLLVTLSLSERSFVDLSSQMIKQLQRITSSNSRVVWLTNGDLLRGANPEAATISGFSRAAMAEEAALQIATLDLDGAATSIESTAGNIIKILDRMGSQFPEFEYTQRESVLYTSKFEPTKSNNNEFLERCASDLAETSVAACGRVQLSIEQPGQTSTLRFVQRDFAAELQDDEVEIDVMSIGINAKDAYVLAAKVDTKDVSCSCECSGIVRRVGSHVSSFSPGDRIAALAPGHFATRERIPEWACVKLESGEDFDTFSAFSVALATALHALKYCAKLEADETVLIHSGAGGVGIAAIQVAQWLGAEVFVTVGHESKRDFLTREHGIPADHIFYSRDESFLTDVLAATGGRGVDVVLNSLVGDLLHASFKACADFGRFIEIGKRDILDHGSLDMGVFERNVSFTAFDLHKYYASPLKKHHRMWQSILRESIELLRGGIVKTVGPLRVFDGSDVIDAFRYFSQADRVGKVVVSFAKRDSLLKVVPEPYGSHFSAEKTYIMIGCLGGLGRSLASWMVSLGARNFVFMGPSGAQKPAAQGLVQDLEGSGCQVVVVKGNVAVASDVAAAMDAAQKPIGGVIQGAMSLHESLWNAMTHQKWNAGLAPKVHGTWHLHNALRNRDQHLDFFLMLSSAAGSVGFASESNYCAGNAFLDAFARFRTAQNLPATSVGFGMIRGVGYLYENPENEKLMAGKAMQRIDEDAFLHVVDIALRESRALNTKSTGYDPLGARHTLTGISIDSLESGTQLLGDPRAALYAAARVRRATSSTSGSGAGSSGSDGELAQALAAGPGAGMVASVLGALSRKMAGLTLSPVERLRAETMLGELGLDSMLAAEFRAYVFRTFRVDVPFLMLLAPGTTLSGIAGFVGGKIAGGSGGAVEGGEGKGRE